MNKGKSYANRKPESERPENDFYPTPGCMVKELLEAQADEWSKVFNIFKGTDILDPCCGKYAIGNVLREYGYDNLTERDIVYGDDYLESTEAEKHDVIIMNPPFKLFNRFVEKAKKEAFRVCCIGKVNYFGAHDRNVKGLWEHLEWVLPFDRMIAYDKPEHDGKVEMGMMVTGWFIWNDKYNGFPKIKVLDMQKYAYHKGE